MTATQQLPGELPSIAISSIRELRVFMEHHVFAVWDFMSLLKYLQQALAPASVPWLPPANPEAARLINEIVLHEESDEAAVGGHPGRPHESHFQTYLRAMEEVGADTRPIRHFLELVTAHGVREALNWARMPEPARRFTRATFRLLAEDRPHCVAAAFAFGRENLLPDHFADILDGLRLASGTSGVFRHYLRRHVSLDGDDHGPAARRLVSSLCGEDPQRQAEARRAAVSAVAVRRQFTREIADAMNAAGRKPAPRLVSWKILHQELDGGPAPSTSA